MAERVHERTILLKDAGGVLYDRVHVYAEPLRGGTWGGSLEFLAADGTTSARTGRETTQSTMGDLLYWAGGLEDTYLEGALARALGQRERPTVPTAEAPAPPSACSRIQIETLDPDVPCLVMASRRLAPGLRRRVSGGGVLVYEGPARPAAEGEPVRYVVLAQCGSDNAAAVLANTLWTDLHGRAARITVDGEEVALDHQALKLALLGTPV